MKFDGCIRYYAGVKNYWTICAAIVQSMVVYYLKHLFEHHRDGMFAMNIMESFVIDCSTMPDYFKAVKQPIDITRIQQKIKTEEYDSFDAFCADIALLIDNAKVFYKVCDV
jgi:hypothetical protein